MQNRSDEIIDQAFKQEKPIPIDFNKCNLSKDNEFDFSQELPNQAQKTLRNLQESDKKVRIFA